MPKAYTVERVRVGTGGGIGLRSAESANTESSHRVEVKLNLRVKSSCRTMEDGWRVKSPNINVNGWMSVSVQSG